MGWAPGLTHTGGSAVPVGTSAPESRMQRNNFHGVQLPLLSGLTLDDLRVIVYVFIRVRIAQKPRVILELVFRC